MTFVTFLSDYGLADEFVGVCHGVIARIAPAVVDPGVGSERGAVALRCAEEGCVLVGPDNGLLSLVTTFADVPPGDLLFYEDAYGALSLAINRASAFEALGLEIYGRVQIARVE